MSVVEERAEKCRVLEPEQRVAAASRLENAITNVDSNLSVSTCDPIYVQALRESACALRTVLILMK